MWSKFRARGKSIILDAATSPTANAKGSSPTPQSTFDASDDDEEEEEEVTKSFKKIFTKNIYLHAGQCGAGALVL